MARRPSVTRAPKQKPAAAEEETPAENPYVTAINRIADVLERQSLEPVMTHILEQLRLNDKAADAAPVVQSVEAKLATGFDISITRIEKIEAKLDRVLALIEDPGNAAAASDALLATPMPVNGEPPKRKRGRPSNEEKAARAAAEAAARDPLLAATQEGKALAREDRREALAVAEPVAIKNNDVVDQGAPPPKETIFRNIDGKMVEVDPTTLKPISAAPVPPPAPSPAPAPTPAAPSVDDIRAVAITYASKHGKDGLAKALAKYGSDRLSGVPEEQRAALMAELQAGV